MKKSLILAALAVVVVVGAGVWLQSSSAPASNAAAVSAGVQSPQQPASDQQTAAATSAPAATLMQSTGASFASSSDYVFAHEVFPTASADAAKALGAFSIQTQDLGGGATRVTLVNNGENAEAQGNQNQSVIVGAGQSVYFVERSPRDDTKSEDSNTKDDYLVAVDAQGAVLR